MKSLQHHIDGRWVAPVVTGERFPVIDPATESQVAEICMGSAADVDLAVAAAGRAFASFAVTPLDARLDALRRINEGAAMIRSKGEAGTGDVSNATTHMRAISGEIRRLSSLREDELYVAAKEMQAPYELVKEIAATGKLPVVLFTAGGIATPADAAMMMQLGADGVFVGSGIFKSGNPEQRAAAIVKAVTFFDDPKVVGEVSRGLGEAMVGINVADIPVPHRLAERGW